MVDRGGIQRLAVHLVAVVMQPYDDGVWMEYHLHVLCLLDLAIGHFDGERDEMISIISLESHQDCVGVGVIASLV